jgi:transcriptional regulator with XRE-family HTH domain
MSTNTPPLYDVGAALRARRKEANLTQSRLAEAAGLPDSNCISRIENGRDYNEMLTRLDYLAAALGMSPQELIFEARTTTLGHGGAA